MKGCNMSKNSFLLEVICNQIGGCKGLPDKKQGGGL